MMELGEAHVAQLVKYEINGKSVAVNRVTRCGSSLSEAVYEVVVTSFADPDEKKVIMYSDVLEALDSGTVEYKKIQQEERILQ
jgi:hypothetical protein